jgi:hypothetical protein
MLTKRVARFSTARADPFEVLKTALVPRRVRNRRVGRPQGTNDLNSYVLPLAITCEENRSTVAMATLRCTTRAPNSAAQLLAVRFDEQCNGLGPYSMAPVEDCTDSAMETLPPNPIV